MKSSWTKSHTTASPCGRGAGAEHARSSSEPWILVGDDACMNDVETFGRTVAAVKSRAWGDGGSSPPPRADMLASVLSHYAARWLPDVAAVPSSASSRFLPPESPTTTWLKKRLLLETLVAALPPADVPGAAPSDGITCDFLLKLLHAGSMVGAGAALLHDLEARAARRLDQATLAAVMIPAFGQQQHARGASTLLDVPLVLRLVRGFLKESTTAKGAGAAAARVARLVDAYLAEAALESGLPPAELEELASAVPAHARASDDALYRAIDTYLKAHPATCKEERKSLCGLIDARKLSAEAAAHAVQNDRLPVRSVVQVLFSEHGKLNRLAELGASSFTGARGTTTGQTTAAMDLAAGRCPSKREVAAQQHKEVRRLREDVARLQVQCGALQDQVERLSGGDRRRCGSGSGGGGGFRWSTLWFGGGGGMGGGGDVARVEHSESGMELRTPASGKKGRSAATATPKWRRMSLQ